MLTMEGVDPTTRGRATLKDGDQSTDDTLLSSKPLHRFVQTQPRALGVAILIFGCAEVLMGFLQTGSDQETSARIYAPFWQGVLFLICGTLSIYTEVRPSKKMVTVCLSLYVVTLLGIVVSAVYRITFLCRRSAYRRWAWWAEWEVYRWEQLMAIESVLLSSSLCVFLLLFVLVIVARLALKSSHTEVIIRHIPAPQRDSD